MRDFFRRFELDFDAHRAVVHRARHHGLAVLSTPLSESAVVMLEDLALDGYKMASGDLTYDSLIATIARTRPAGGVVDRHERDVGDQPRAVGGVGCRRKRRCAAPLRLGVPDPSRLAEPAGDYHARCDSRSACRSLRSWPGLASAVIAAAFGACLYERHLMLDGDEDAIDRAVSSTPHELAAIVKAMADTRAALGTASSAACPSNPPISPPAAAVCTPRARCATERSSLGLTSRYFAQRRGWRLRSSTG